MDDATGESGIGFGPQEEFYGCADIKIMEENEETEVTNFTTPAQPTESITVTKPPPTHFCRFNKKISLGLTLPDSTKPFLDDLCQCACEIESGLCSSILCQCTKEECRLFGAIGSFRATNNSNAWCNEQCEKGQAFCPEEKCACFVFSGSRGIEVTALTVLVQFSVLAFLLDKILVS